jgi:hypothetical protein
MDKSKQNMVACIEVRYSYTADRAEWQLKVSFNTETCQKFFTLSSAIKIDLWQRTEERNENISLRKCSIAVLRGVFVYLNEDMSVIQPKGYWV